MGKDPFARPTMRFQVVRRGEPFTFPSSKFLVHCDNGLPHTPRNGAFPKWATTLQRGVVLHHTPQQTTTLNAQLKSRSDSVTLYFVRDKIFAKRLTQPARGTPPQRPCNRQALQQMRSFHGGQLSYAQCLAQVAHKPIALFGGVFSHMDVEHISANYYALQMCAGHLQSPCTRQVRTPVPDERAHVPTRRLSLAQAPEEEGRWPGWGVAWTGCLRRDLRSHGVVEHRAYQAGPGQIGDRNHHRTSSGLWYVAIDATGPPPRGGAESSHRVSTTIDRDERREREG